MRQISQTISEKQDEILADVKNLVEQQYCPIHGKFAEFEGIDGKLGEKAGAKMRFSCCCDDLRAQVEQTISAVRGNQ